MVNPYEKRIKMSKAMKKKQEDPEFVEKKNKTHSESAKKMWEDPIYRAKNVQERQERWNDKEWAEAQTKRLNESQTPEVCKKISEKIGRASCRERV